MLEVEAGGFQVQGQPRQKVVRLHLKNKIQNKKGWGHVRERERERERNDNAAHFVAPTSGKVIELV
jgi:hypothetical protein